MNRITKLFIHAFVVVASLAAFTAVCPNAQAQTAKTDEQIRLKAEKQEVQKFVDSFLQSFEESKDFNKISESYFVNNFKTRFSQKEGWRLRTSEEVFAQFSDKERYEHNASMLNFIYLGLMRNIQKYGMDFSLEHSDDSEIEEFKQSFPPKIMKLVKQNKTLYSIYVYTDDIDAEISNVVELQNLVSDVKNIVEIQREHLNQLAPSWKSKYHKEMSKARKRFDDYKSETCVKNDCKDLPENTQIISATAFPFAFEIVRENSELKILDIEYYSE